MTAVEQTEPPVKLPGRALPEREALLTTVVPLCLAVVGVVALIGFVIAHASDYGRTYDEPIQDYYGQLIYQWYATRGADRSFLGLANDSNMLYYGPAYELLVAWLQHLTGDQWHTRALVGGLTGVLGIAGMVLVGRQIAGWWGGVAAGTALALFPRYFGAMANNSKDIPLAAAMIFVLWATIRLVQRWDGASQRRRVGDAVVLGVLLGIATSIRSIAVVWFAVLVLVIVGRWLALRARQPVALAGGASSGSPGIVRAELRAQVLAALIGGVVWYAVILALFPYVFLHPLTGLLDSVLLMSRYDWPGFMLFDGQMIAGKEAPWYYAPTWLAIGSPPVTVALGLVGLGFLAADATRRRFEPAALLAAGLFVIPLMLIIVRQATLYNGLRQYLFVVPGMILLGVFALRRLAAIVRGVRRPAVAIGLATIVAAVLAVGHAQALAATIRLYPLEYVYFSPIVGGFAGAYDRYEKDYWHACESLSADWVYEHREQLGLRDDASVSGVLNAGYIPLPPGIRPAGQDERPDIVVSDERSPGRDDYRLVHEITAEGVPVCWIQLDPQRYPTAGGN